MKEKIKKVTAPIRMIIHHIGAFLFSQKCEVRGYEDFYYFAPEEKIICNKLLLFK